MCAFPTPVPRQSRGRAACLSPALSCCWQLGDEAQCGAGDSVAQWFVAAVPVGIQLGEARVARNRASPSRCLSRCQEHRGQQATPKANPKRNIAPRSTAPGSPSRPGCAEHQGSQSSTRPNMRDRVSRFTLHLSPLTSCSHLSPPLSTRELEVDPCLPPAAWARSSLDLRGMVRLHVEISAACSSLLAACAAVTLAPARRAETRDLAGAYCAVRIGIL